MVSCGFFPAVGVGRSQAGPETGAAFNGARTVGADAQAQTTVAMGYA